MGSFGDAFVQNTNLEGGMVAPSIDILCEILASYCEIPSDVSDALDRIIAEMKVAADLDRRSREVGPKRVPDHVSMASFLSSNEMDSCGAPGNLTVQYLSIVK